MNRERKDGKVDTIQEYGRERTGKVLTAERVKAGGFLWCGRFAILSFTLAFLVPALLCTPSVARGSDTETAWTALMNGRAVALIRHAMAPGVGDPPGFRLDDCSTQRNLSEEGRAQSLRIGRFFRSKGIQEGRLFSSQWCRCLETARLLGLGTVVELPLLNSFFEAFEKEREQTRQTRRFLASLPAGPPVLLVTHQVNITALTGVTPASGEIVIFSVEQNGSGKVLGRVVP